MEPNFVETYFQIAAPSLRAARPEDCIAIHGAERSDSKERLAIACFADCQPVIMPFDMEMSNVLEPQAYGFAICQTVPQYRSQPSMPPLSAVP
jgi:hypothetical protein